jgi:hypothetical protein
MACLSIEETPSGRIQSPIQPGSRTEKRRRCVDVEHGLTPALGAAPNLLFSTHLYLITNNAAPISAISFRVLKQGKNESNDGL